MLVCIYNKSNGDICGREIYDREKELCVFHAEKKDSEKFSQSLDEKMKENYDFEGYIFPENWDWGTDTMTKASFKYAIFLGEVGFQDIIFRGESNFQEAKFLGAASFWGAKFVGVVNFEEAEFRGAAIFLSARFGYSATFEGAKFYKEAEFKEARFRRTANFNGVEFNGAVSFSGANFVKEMDFQKTIFNNSAQFDLAIFKDNVNFSGAQFSEKVTFNAATFHGSADFDNVDFKGDVIFSKAKFKKRVNFASSEFLSRSYFEKTSFEKSASFERGSFLGPKTLFWETKFSSDTPTYFNNADLRNVTFRDTRLERTTFSGSKFDKVDFMPMEFSAQKSFIIGERNHVLYDEIKGEDPKEVKRLYLELKKKAEEMRDYQSAGDFYIGEMEMTYKTLNFGVRKILIGSYWFFSGYGERYPLALKWNVFFAFLFFPMMYTLTGFKYQRELITDTLQRIFHSFLYSLHTFVPLHRFGIYEPASNFFSVAFTIIESILGPVLITLFLLALRRRFKR